MAQFALQKTRGALCLIGPEIDGWATKALASPNLRQSRLTSAPLPYHITLITKDELRGLSSDRIAGIKLDTRHIFAVGVGGTANEGVFWVVVIWGPGQQIRKQFGLPPKDFHITLSGNDNHNIDKSIMSLLPEEFPTEPTFDFLDHLTFSLHFSGHYQQAEEHSISMVLQNPISPKGYLRLADAAIGNQKFKTAMLSYACSHSRSDDPRLRVYCLKKLFECSRETEWGAVFQEHEIMEIQQHPSVVHLLLSPWPLQLREQLMDGQHVPSLRLEPRQSLFVPQPSTVQPIFYKLPRFFRWIIPFYLAAMSTPRNEDDISALACPHIGIRHILTLTEETPLQESWFRRKHIKNTFLPIPNFHPPSIEQMDIIVGLFDDERKVPLLVHCGGGKGRAGTVITCYLAAFGFNKPSYGQDRPEISAADAISLLRSLRPGSLETSQQEAFVSTWCSTIWKRQCVYPDLPVEPPPCSMSVEGKLDDSSNLFMLVGFPGSGKSWLSQSLVSRDPNGWLRVSQDDSGSRMSCETEVGRTHTKRVLLDRCNTAAKDRKFWMSLASNWCQAAVCVWFDYDSELCTARAQRRANHPTLPPGGRVRSAVEQMQNVFVKPTLEEGFSAIVTIRSFKAAGELLLYLSPYIGIYKFPRTPHLVDLGAASSDDIHIDVSSVSTLASEKVFISEKIDGANMGFSLSFDRSKITVQNRSHFVNPSTHEQFKKLGLWVERHEDDLRMILDQDPYFPERYILFGEWMYATHSIPYSRLPDLFMAFDLYDRKSQTFSGTDALRDLLVPTAIHPVPVLYEGTMPSREDLLQMIQRDSAFYDGRVEGVYLKVELNGVVKFRGKVVRSDFIAGNDHWTKGKLQMNGLAVHD